MYGFEYLGALFLWMFELTFYKKKPSFKDVLKGKERFNDGDLVDMGAYGMKLKVIGLIVTVMIISLLAKV